MSSLLMSLANKEVALLWGLPESFLESQGEPGSFGAVGCVFLCGVPCYGGSSGASSRAWAAVLSISTLLMHHQAKDTAE